MRRYQQKATQPEGDENGGVVLQAQQQEALSAQLQAGTGLTPLPRSRRAQSSTTDPDSRFLRARDGWVLGYTADLAVSQDHFIVATRVTQQATDNASLVPMIEEVKRQCRSHPEKVSADSGFFSGQALEFLDQRYRRLSAGQQPKARVHHRRSGPGVRSKPYPKPQTPAHAGEAPKPGWAADLPKTPSHRRTFIRNPQTTTLYSQSSNNNVVSDGSTDGAW